MNRKVAIIALALVPLAAGGSGPLRYAEDRAPAIVNPIFATTMSEARLNEIVFEGLFTDDQELRSTPDLAESWTLASDKKSVVIELRRDARWHDGTQFTSKDVVFTIDAMRNPATASTESGRVAWIKSAKAEGSHRVRIDFLREEWAPEDKLHFKILPSHKFAGTSIKRTDPFRTNPVGTGPYQVLAFNDDNSITMRRFDEHHGQSRIDEVQMREVADKNYQAKLLMYESLEALVRVLPRDIAALQNDRKIELYPYQTNSWWYVGFDIRQERFEDPKVRQALAMMIDVEQLLAPIGTGDMLSGPFVKSSPFYNHDVPIVRADSGAARALLEQAGWTLNGRQWTDKAKKAVTLRLSAPDNLETAQDVVINLQSQLQDQGITVQPEFLGAADWKQRVWKDRNFDLILSQWSFDRNEDIYEQFHSKGTRNFVSYGNPAVDKLLDDARTAADPQQKKALLRQAHAAIATDQPMVFLWTLDSYSALSVRVRNVVVHPFYFFTWADGWKLE
jgi:peptide/nickel transport system substrate-binding protein